MQTLYLMESLHRPLAFSKHPLTVFSLLNTGISITNHAYLTPSFIRLQSSRARNKSQLVPAATMVAFTYWFSHPSVRLFNILSLPSTLLLFQFLVCVLRVSTFPHIHCRILRSYQNWIKSGPLICYWGISIAVLTVLEDLLGNQPLFLSGHNTFSPGQLIKVWFTCPTRALTTESTTFQITASLAKICNVCCSFP